MGLREHFNEVAALRAALPDHVYLWINAYKRIPNYYSEKDVQYLTNIDPHFPMNNSYHPSFGQSCQAGLSSFTVDGQGLMRRCHFIAEPIGNIYDSSFDAALSARECEKDSCGCFIGYVHLETLDLYNTFGDGILERIPQSRVLSV